MGLLYVNENGAQIGYEANKCVVNYKDGLKKLIPIESLEGITIMGLIIPGLFEPPVRTLRATIPENESHIFR